MPDISKIKFRNFEEKDLNKIIKFKKDSADISFPGLDIDTNIFKKRLLNRVKNDPNSVKVAEIDSEIIGYVFLEIKKASTGPIGYINHVFVSEPYRKSGLGTRFMQIAENYLKSRGIKRVRVTVTKTNKTSLNFCKKMGYVEKRLILEKPLN